MKPNTRYRMFWSGKWRPVIKLIDAMTNEESDNPMRAKAAVLWIEPLSFHSPEGWCAVQLTPGAPEVLSNPDYQNKWVTLD